MPVPTLNEGFTLNVNFVLAAAALFISAINFLWDRVRLEHRITKVETMLEIYFKSMTEDATHVVKHETQTRKDDLVDKRIRNLTNDELEELHGILVMEMPLLRKREDEKLPGFAVTKAMIEIEQFKRLYPPTKGWLEGFLGLFRIKKAKIVLHKDVVGIVPIRPRGPFPSIINGSIEDKNKDFSRNATRDSVRDPVRDTMRDGIRDDVRDRTRDQVRDRDRDETKDKKTPD